MRGRMQHHNSCIIPSSSRTLPLSFSSCAAMQSRYHCSVQADARLAGYNNMQWFFLF